MVTHAAFALDDFTLPQEGSDTLRRVLSRLWPALVRDLATLPRATDDPLRTRITSRVASLWNSDPASAARLARQPSITARVRIARHNPARLSLEAHRALDRDVAVELAATRAFGASLRVTRPTSGWTPLRLPSRGVSMELDESVESITFEDGALRVDDTLLTLDDALSPGRGVTPREGWRSIDGRVALALVDDNPSATSALHPSRAQGNALDLGGRDASEWCDAMRAAIALVDAHLPRISLERRLLARVIVPVGVDDERHDSCTYEGAPGAMYLSLHPDPVKLAEAIVHEFQHDKLHALLRFDPLVENARDEGFRSPVRPDPRPLRGVLLAAHAFLPVAAMYRAMREAKIEASAHPRFEARVEAVRAANLDAMAVLRESAKPTALGARLLRELEALARALT